MAYITNYAYNHLVEHIEIKDISSYIDKAFFRKNIYDNDYLYHMFNQLDLEKVLKDKILSSGDEDYNLAYREIPDHVDRKIYIYEKQGSVKYHKTRECESLKSGFKDFFIPETIQRVEQKDKVRHEKLVNHIREWFLKNNYTVGRYLDNDDDLDDNYLTRQFNKNFAPQFDLDKIVVSQSEKNQFKWYEDKNTSGSHDLSNDFDYDKFIIDISNLLKKRYDLCTGYAWESISKHDYLHKKSDHEIMKILYMKQNDGKLGNVKESFITKIGVNKIKTFLIEHRELKEQAVQGLSDYFKWTYNFKQDSFDKVFLEDFNLKPCMMCYNVVGRLQ